MQRRPTYESARNRQDETITASIIERWAKCKLIKQPMQKYIDWIAYRNNQPVAHIEFKRRNNNRLQYPTYMVSANKWKNGRDMAHKDNIPFLLFIRWNDGLFYLKASDDIPVTYGTGGRQDRNDAADIEQMVYINTNLFKQINLA